MKRIAFLILLTLFAHVDVHAGVRELNGSRIRNGSAVLSLPTVTDTMVGRATTDTITNKTIDGGTNTLQNIPSSALTPGSADQILPSQSGNAGKSLVTNGSASSWGPAPVAASMVQEAPSGTVDGVNNTFVLSNAPPNTGRVLLLLDGIGLVQGVGNDYTISGAAIMLNVPPAAGQSLLAFYPKN